MLTMSIWEKKREGCNLNRNARPKICSLLANSPFTASEASRELTRTHVSFRVLLSHDFSRPPKRRACWSDQPWKVTIINSCAKLNQAFIQSVWYSSDAFINKNFCLPIRPLKINDISLEKQIQSFHINLSSIWNSEPNRLRDIINFALHTLIGNMVTLSGESILYQTHKLPLFCATTTSLSGTHCTYVQ